MSVFGKKYTWEYAKVIQEKRQNDRQEVEIQGSVFPIFLWPEDTITTMRSFILQDIYAKYHAMIHDSSYAMIISCQKQLLSLPTMSSLSLWSNELTTFVQDPTSLMSVRSSVLELYKENLIRIEKIPVFWSKKTQNTVFPTDVITADRPGKLYYVRYFVDTKKDSFVVPVARPETLFGDVWIAVNPADKRFKKYIWKKMIVPIINRIVPIVGDEDVPLWDRIGIRRICPAHDDRSYTLARRHNLPLDIYSFDTKGIFTNHAGIYAGKPIEQFTSNIVQYLQDIHNLDSIESAVHSVPYSISQDEYLEHYLMDSCILDTTTLHQSLLDYIGSGKVSFVSEWFKQLFLEYIENRELFHIGISDTSSWLLFPLLWSTPLHEEDHSSYRDLFFYLLIYNWYIGSSFSIWELMDSLMKDIEGVQLLSFLHTFIQQTYPWVCTKEDLALIESVCDDSELSDFVWLSEKIVDYLDVNRWIEYKNSLYHVSDATYGFNQLFLQYTLSLLSSQKATSTTIAVPQWLHKDHGLFMLHNYLLCLVAMQQTDKTLTIYTMPVYTDINKKLFTTSYKNFVDEHGPDALRLACLDDAPLDLANLEQYNQMIQKFWNAARYISITYPTKEILSLDELSSYVEKNFHNLTEFDQWMLYRLYELDKKLSTHNDKDLQFISSYVIATIIDDICIKYIEVIKTTSNNHTPYVLRFVVASACLFLHPFVPFVTEMLRSLYWFDWSLQDMQKISQISLWQRNYKVHLLMNIIGSLYTLKQDQDIKKHEKVIVCIKASIDMITFVQSYEQLIYTIINAESIQFVTSDLVDISDYITNTIIDIVVWLRKSTTQAWLSIQSLEQKLQEKQKYLQHLRWLISLWTVKHEEIQQLKTEIDSLELQIIQSKYKN